MAKVEKLVKEELILVESDRNGQLPRELFAGGTDVEVSIRYVQALLMLPEKAEAILWLKDVAAFMRVNIRTLKRWADDERIGFPRHFPLAGRCAILLPEFRAFLARVRMQSRQIA